MTLSSEEVARFYSIFMPLLMFVNRRKKLAPHVKALDLDHPIDPADAKVLRDALWADKGLIAEFVAKNPAGLNAKDLATAQSWQHGLKQSYMVVKHLKRHSIFAAKGKHYAVVGLTSPLKVLLPETPTFVETALIPFAGKITYDSLFSAPGPRITFGPGIRRSCNEEYQEARRAGLIIRSPEDLGAEKD